MPTNKCCVDKILISACFLGQKVRYNGQVKPLINEYLALWSKQNRLMAICPEVKGGLPVPRPPAEISQQTGQVITCNNVDVTEQFNSGAQQALQLCRQNNIRFALLKESSPSCGSSHIYDGNFSQQKISGEGITSKLLRSHGIQVFSENTINDLAKKIKG